MRQRQKKIRKYADLCKNHTVLAFVGGNTPQKILVKNGPTNFKGVGVSLNTAMLKKNRPPVVTQFLNFEQLRKFGYGHSANN
jgi:hypothetical protein